MQTYKLRAEAWVDLVRLADALTPRGAQPLRFTSLSIRMSYLDNLPNCEMELDSPLSLGELLSVIATIEDGHVMYETVQPVDHYTGKRDWNRSPPVRGLQHDSDSAMASETVVPDDAESLLRHALPHLSVSYRNGCVAGYKPHELVGLAITPPSCPMIAEVLPLPKAIMKLRAPPGSPGAGFGPLIAALIQEVGRVGILRVVLITCDLVKILRVPIERHVRPKKRSAERNRLQ